MSGIYIHIPFCHAKCAYCDFFSTPRMPADTAAFVDAIIDEYSARRDELTEPVTTVYIGGGTPSSLPPAQLRRLAAHFSSLSPKEFTVEVNPEDVSYDLARMLSDEGVSRVSMGVQSLIDAELKAVGRRHTASQAVEAAITLRRGGIANLSLDLIYGLPLQTLQSWRHSVATLLQLRPQHISAYALSYEPGTRLWAIRQAGKTVPVSEEVSAEMYASLCSDLAGGGYDHYEIANFGLPGFHSLHNASYWNFTPYLGLGPAAHSFDGNVRRYNPSNIQTYMSAVPGSAAIIDEETADNRHNDYVMVALRTDAGLDIDDYQRRFGPTAARRAIQIAESLAAQGVMQPTPTGYRIAESHWIASDPIIIRFFR